MKKKSIAFLLAVIILVSAMTTALAVPTCPECGGGCHIESTSYGNWFDVMIRVDKDIFGLITGILWGQARFVNEKCSCGKTHSYTQMKPNYSWYAKY